MPYADPRKRKAHNKAYFRKHYEANKEAYFKRARAHDKKIIEEVRAWLLAYLLIHPCIDCGEPDPVVLEFDHVSGIKLFALGTARSRRMPLQRVLDEVAKCEVRCANCHRRKTYRERGFTHRGLCK